jgi:heme exporter protein D
MNRKLRNTIIDILGILIIIGAGYKEFFTENPFGIWVWMGITAFGIAMIVFTVKDIKGKMGTIINKIIKKKLG